MLTGVFQVMTVYEEVNSYLCSTGRKLAAYSQVFDEKEKINLYKLFYADLKNSGIESENLVGGMAGLVPVVKQESDLIQIKVTYGVKVPGYFINSRTVLITDSVYVRPWLGASIGGKGSNSDNKQTELVYVAENGVVYHKNENCSYLALSIQQCRMQDVEALRNKYGAKYIQCERCGKSANANTVVYITDSGRAWHVDRQCSGLKRNLSAMTQEEAEKKGLRPCSRCGNH